MYGYTPRQIADMTPHQQRKMLEDDDSDASVRYLSFKDMREYQRWVVDGKRRNSNTAG